MTRIHVLSPTSDFTSIAWLFPLKYHQKALQQSGVFLQFFSSLSASLRDADILFINSKYFKNTWSQHSQQTLETLDALSQQVSVFWFDTSDGTGTPHFAVLPYVHSYYKTHLLNDKAQYTTPFYGGRCYTEFYYQHFGITDKEPLEGHLNAVAPKKYLHKLHVGWNLYLGDYGISAKFLFQLRKRGFLPFRFRWNQLTPVTQPRPIQVFCRMSTNHPRNTVAFQRQQIMNILSQQFTANASKVSLRQYWKELQQAQVGISPFGYGEFAYRDYEIFLCGALLLKPDMSHLQTWPEFYHPQQTYVPFRWEIDDFAQILEEWLLPSNLKRRQEVAANAQSIYKEHLIGPKAAELFCQHIHGLLL